MPLIGRKHEHDYPDPTFYADAVWRCTCGTVFAINDMLGERRWGYYEGPVDGDSGSVFWVAHQRKQGNGIDLSDF